MTKNNAVVLLSGGLDSAAAALSVKNNYDKIYALFFDYGQKAIQREERAAKEISDFYGFEFIKINAPGFLKFSNSAMNKKEELPNPDESRLDDKDYMQNFANAVYVPNRNAIFVNIAAGFAETVNASDIIIGANREEAGTFKDNSKEFISAENVALKNSTNAKITLIAPLIDLNKTEIVKLCAENGLPFEKIHSCYDDKAKHCGKCESCKRLRRALELNGRHDIINKVFGD